MTHDHAPSKPPSIILIGDAANTRVARIAEAYRTAGYSVVIQSAHQTRAVGGKTFHTIVVDELAQLADRFDSFQRQSEMLRDSMRELSTKLIKASLQPPNNQPHGPQRKTRGGKIRRW